MVSICLNMIVKNEAHIIVKTLENILQYIPITYWVISDTGSTDNTQQIIKDFFNKRNIPGELYQDAWKDFGYNRSLALKYAYNKTDYLFIFDADDTINGDLILPSKLDKDCYFLKFGTTFTYKRILLINNRIKWIFRGVLHEFIQAYDVKDFQEEIIEGEYHIVSGKSGSRSNDPQKYLKDATILENAYQTETDEKIKDRYAFYCAQSYKDSGKNDKAIEWYKKCLEKNWNQERYVSCIEIGNLSEEWKDKINYWIKSAEYDSERIEGIVKACELLRTEGNHLMVNLLYERFKNYKNVSDKLFLTTTYYNDELEYNNSISAYYSNNHNSAFECCKKILTNQILPKNKLEQTINNMFFYKQHHKNDEIFQAINKYIQNNSSINQNTFKLWNNSFNEKIYTQYNPIQLNERKNKEIILTMTTCKRFDLFQKTINSICNTWLDLDKIDFWFCVDDNSSKEDREQMANKYSWIHFYWKSEEEKGHRTSMNIIWDKLNELKPKYWIHIEDDFLFFLKENYVSNSIRFIEETGFQQILFNRNYGEVIEDYQILGHKIVNNEVVEHQYKMGKFPYRNCHYWPNFSFRPGVIKVDVILDLGNFNSTNTFFEMDYAERWTNQGYKTGFWNKICCKHIGKLTSENKPNAYTLNNQQQFGTTINIVNLAKRVDRKEEMVKEMHKIPFNYKFSEAVDGKKLDLTLEIRNLFLGNDFNSRKGVIGCALTHLNLWKKLLASKEEYMIILEDDIKFDNNAGEVMRNIDYQRNEILFLGYHMFENDRKRNWKKYNENNGTSTIGELDKKLYIGGTFGYSINRKGAEKLIYYIEKNGIKHGIDYLIKISDVNCKELCPQIVFSEWNENGKKIDTDIQRDYEHFKLFDDFVFVAECDQIDFDINWFSNLKLEEMFKKAKEMDECVAFNTMGYFKIKIKNLVRPSYFKGHGIFIKKSYYEKINKLKKVKMICDWTNPKGICNEWKTMCKEGLTWNNLELTWGDNADYYVIINKPSGCETYEEKKTIVFQMEPWVNNANYHWGVKTWGEWATPDEKKFLAVRGRKTDCHNNAFWQLELNYNQLKRLKYKKQDKLSSICSSKYFDEGHIARVDFLKFLEEKGDIPMDIYGWDNKHNFKNHIRGLDFYKDKSEGYVPYKYYFMVENNYEKNFITEKVWEPILCETLVFYYGCPNLKDYIDERAYVQLDMNDFEKSYNIIKQAFEQDWWSQRLLYIQQEKQKIMEKLGFFPVIEDIINKTEETNSKLF